MQIGAVIIGVPVGIEIVVPPRKALVVRPSFPDFPAIDFCVVVPVVAFKYLLPTPEDRKAIDHLRIFPRCHILVQPEENLLIQPNTARAGHCPASGWPQVVIRRPGGYVACKQNGLGSQKQARDKCRKGSLPVHWGSIASLIAQLVALAS